MSGARSHSGEAWMLFASTTATGAASLRVAVWRKLRSLGALYVQQSVCLLPARPEVVREVRRLADRISSQGGSARVMTIRFEDAREESDAAAALSAARDDEYGEVLERVPAFLEELRLERARDRTTYEEVEESEADLERFRAWLAKIDRRDYFGAERRAEAHAAVDECARALEAFEAEAFARDAGDDAPVKVQAPRLRSVDDS